MSKTRQPEGTVHKIQPGVTPWPIVTPAIDSTSRSTPVETGSTDQPENSRVNAEEAMVWEGTEQDARRLRRARMLPEKGPLTADHIDAVRKSVRRFKDETGVSLAKLGREIDVSGPTVSQFLSDSYSGDNERIARALNGAIERLARVEEARLPDDWFGFDQAVKMLKVISAAVADKQMGLITAPSGGCKTTTLEAARRQHPGAVLVRVTAGTKSAGGMMDAVAHAVGSLRGKSVGTVQREIINELSGTSRPLLIDEAQQLNDKALEAVRDLHDCAKIPVVFAGTDQLALAMDDRAKWLGQLRSRIVHRFHAVSSIAGAGMAGGGGAGGGGKNRPRLMFTADELCEWMTRQGVRLTDDGASFLCQIANIPEMGCLRFALQVVRRARTHKDYQNNKPLDARVLRTIAAVIHGITFEHLFAARVDQLRLTAVA